MFLIPLIWPQKGADQWCRQPACRTGWGEP